MKGGGRIGTALLAAVLIVEQTPAMAGSAPAQGLQGYCTGSGLTPLASEWWHFNDLNTYQRISDNQGTGGFTITQCLSRTP